MVGNTENLRKKEALCVQAETYTNSTNWQETHQLFKQLQAEWKQIGFTSKGADSALWERFRAAIDNFYARRQEYFEQSKKEREQKHEEWLQRQAYQQQRHQEWLGKQEAALMRKVEQRQRLATSIQHDEMNIARWRSILSSIRPGKRAAEIHSRTVTKIFSVQAKINSKQQRLHALNTQIADIEYNLRKRIFEPEGKVFRDLK